ncbi:hypothetical protein [Mycobacteroides sp. PCS013]
MPEWHNNTGSPHDVSAMFIADVTYCTTVTNDDLSDSGLERAASWLT